MASEAEESFYLAGTCSERVASTRELLRRLGPQRGCPQVGLHNKERRKQYRVFRHNSHGLFESGNKNSLSRSLIQIDKLVMLSSTLNKAPHYPPHLPPFY